MWISHNTSSAFVKPSFTRHDSCRSVTTFIELLRITSRLQIERNEPTPLCSNPKHASRSKQPLQRELLSDCGKCAGSDGRTPFRFNLESMIFVTRSLSTG